MNDFSLSIISWYRQNKRDLPWRKTKNPYFIWLSEIIMQQTRVEQGTKYYLKFISNYPTVADLAEASEQEILNDWQGLGYYSRARNLHYSAKQITYSLNGRFPDKYSEIIKLKGVGKYTAAAIASFAFNEIQAVVDGNVYRLLSRVFDIALPIDSGQGQKHFQELADELVSKSDPGNHNQAIMEVGALVCTPKKPKCEECPLNRQCLSLKNKTVLIRPVKSKKIKITKRFFHYSIYSFNGKTFIEKRNQKDIWQNLYQFPLLETNEILSKEDKLTWKSQVFESEPIRHVLSHQKINVVFHHFNGKPLHIKSNWTEINFEEFINYPIPRIIDKYLEQNSELF